MSPPPANDRHPKLGLKRTPAYENQVRLAIGGRHLLEGLKGVKRTLLRFQSR